MVSKLELIALTTIPLVKPGDDVSNLICHSLSEISLELNSGDVVVIAQKIISKAENRYAHLNLVSVTPAAITLAKKVDKSPEIVQLILDESKEVIKQRPGAVIVEHNLGYIHANAGIDQSNIHSDDDDPRVLLLPENPDASAEKIMDELFYRTGANVSVIINDSAGRAWRNGTVGFAIGTAGFDPVVDMTGQPDLFKRTLEVTEVAVADELAAGASFLMGQADEGAPVVIIKGANLAAVNMGSERLIRAKAQDLFR